MINKMNHSKMKFKSFNPLLYEFEKKSCNGKYKKYRYCSK